jgi:redox-sensitive bicupin YhaK (pirin superfamily)
VKATVENVEMTGRTTGERGQRAQLRSVSRALQEVHRNLMDSTRDRYELARGPVRSRGELLDLLLHDETFAWLRALSGLIVEIDELAARDPAPTPAETAEVGTLVEAFISSSDDPDAFGSRYVAVLASEPRVAMSHVGLREVLRRGPRAASRPRGSSIGRSSNRAIERASPGPKGEGAMKEQLEKTVREAVLVEDAALIRMMGMPVLEALPSRTVPYGQLDPFILVHEARFRLSDMTNVDTKHPHRGFDNLWYLIEGSASTGHNTGPGGAMERARLTAGALLALRTGRGAWHAEAIGEDEIKEGLGDTEFRGVLFWVNLARKDKQVEPSAQVLQPEQIPVRHEGDATVRVLVGEGSPVRLGTPALILDIELPAGGDVTTSVPPELQGFAYVLEGEAAFGANGRRAKPPQLVLLGPGHEFRVTDASPGTRYLLMAGQPYGEVPVFNGPFVD